MTDSQQFALFLVTAKQNTYAATGGEAAVASLLPGSHQLEYAQGSWLYRDVYFGGDFFVGMETVYEAERPLWCMGYAGGLMTGVDSAVETSPLYDFLREALRHVGTERPFRGPHTYQNGEYAYSDVGDGSLETFWGTETITLHQRPVYQLHYHGGFIR